MRPQDLELAPEEVRLASLPYLRFRPVVTPGYEHYRLVGRGYGREDPRWVREREFLMRYGDTLGFPYVRWVEEGAEEVWTLETGGRMAWRAFVERAGVRRRGEGRGFPVVAPLMVAVLFRSLVGALGRLHEAGLCYRAVTDETVWVEGYGLRWLTVACVGPAEGPGGWGEGSVTRLYRVETTAPVGVGGAPERGEGWVLPAGDIYGVGALMWEGLTGRRWTGEVGELGGVVEGLRGYPGGTGLGAVLQMCLAGEPERRPGARVLEEMLLAVEYGEGRRVSRTAVDLAVEMVLEGAAGGVRGARQQQAWRWVYGEGLGFRGEGPAAVRSAEGLGAKGSPAGVEEIRGLGRRLQAAWRVLRTGRL